MKQKSETNSADSDFSEVFEATESLARVVGFGDSTDHPPDSPMTVFPGSFNPLHAGHLAIAKLAAERLQQPVWFELSVHNVDKSRLAREELRSRLDQDFGHQRVIVSNCATFLAKAQVFPATTFLVGADTILRISNTKYYENDESQRDLAIKQLAELDCRFLVFARKSGNKLWHEANLELPKRLWELCTFVAPAEFLMDVSSTELRNNRTTDES